MKSHIRVKDKISFTVDTRFLQTNLIDLIANS